METKIIKGEMIRDQRVTGSSPVGPTSKSTTYKIFCEWFFCLGQTKVQTFRKIFYYLAVFTISKFSLK